MFSFCNLYLSTLYSRKKVNLLACPTLLFGMSFECSVICTFDVRIKHGDLPFVHSCGCFFIYCRWTPPDELYGIADL